MSLWDWHGTGNVSCLVYFESVRSSPPSSPPQENSTLWNSG